MNHWLASSPITVELHVTSDLATLTMPTIEQRQDLSILAEPISKLRKSRAYPYGLTDNKIRDIEQAGITTVGDLAETKDEELDAIRYIGSQWVERIKSVVAQAIWM